MKHYPAEFKAGRGRVVGGGGLLVAENLGLVVVQSRHTGEETPGLGHDLGVELLLAENVGELDGLGDSVGR
ncbi:hypothetical protein [Streptomyces mirabilis]